MRAYHYCRLDGSTHRVMREVLINQFNKPRSPLFLFCLSTRAGGEGSLSLLPLCCLYVAVYALFCILIGVFFVVVVVAIFSNTLPIYI